MARPPQIASVTPWITEAALAHGHELPAHLMQRLGVSRRRAGALLQQLVQAQWLTSHGTPRRPDHRPGALRQAVRRYALAGLDEDLPWRRDFAPCFALAPEVARLAQHAFTELLNNAIDHSGGTAVTVSMRTTPLQLQLLVSDDGCGLFDRIAHSFGIDDAGAAMLELAKGKLTSQPDRHCGRGLFYTARAADVFDIHANAAAFQRRGWEYGAWRTGRPANAGGTTVYVAIALDTPRTLDAVLREHSADGRGYGFERTVVPLSLLAGGGAALLSRADARRVASNLARFARAELDFDGISDIGHAFADELFRVFRRQHPGVDLVPRALQPRVAEMIHAVTAAA